MMMTRWLGVAMVFVFLTGLTGFIHAENGGITAQEQELNKALEIMKGMGIAPEQMQQIENTMKGMAKQGAKQQAAKLKVEQQEFESTTAKNGTAQVEVEGKRYELKVTKCDITDRSTGLFAIQARQAPGKDNGELWVSGGGGHTANIVQFSARKDRYESDPTEFQFKGKILEWEGVVLGEKGKMPLKFHLTCGVEMVDYAKSSKPSPRTSVNNLTFQLGGETFEFEAGYCSTTEYRTGNLLVEFDATATGMFRGRPAIIFLSKSHPVVEYGDQYFQDLDLFLGELSADQRSLSPREVKGQLEKVWQEYNTKGIAAIQEKYKEMFKSVPPEKLGEVIEAQGKEMDRLAEEVKAIRYPSAISRGGAITVSGRDVHYGGPKMHSNDAARTPEFQDLLATPEVWVTCGN
ncbi:MAG: hypothetical protein O7F12_03215 [Nitrospirae bacterium]|nr:hypothetical protein [Nitrospirota bacterium]